jgi:TPR repeat protein
MANRPNYIDLRSQSQASTSSSRTLRSPRLHVAGEVPPELSPLDAFALQSRLLAKQLEGTAASGRRVSRLPPLTAASPVITQGRSDYFRSRSQDSTSVEADFPEPPVGGTGLGLRTEVADAFGEERPVSMHPRMSRIPPTPDDGIPLPPQPIEEVLRGRQMGLADGGASAFGARREESPTPMESPMAAATPTRLGREVPAHNTFRRSPEKPIRQVGSLDSLALAPPRQLFRSSSTLSSPLEPTQEESHDMSNSFRSLPPRKLSSGSSAPGSSVSIPSPCNIAQRSPSIASEASAHLPRPSFNFSRPLSRAGTPGTPGTETPSRQASADTQPSSIGGDELAHTPVSTSESFESQDDGKAAPSYIYSKFSLPRGKIVQRANPADRVAPASFKWDQPQYSSSNAQTIPRDHPPTPPTRPTSSSSRGVPGDFSLRGPSMDHSRVGPAPQPSPDPSRPSTDESRSSEDVPRGRAFTSPLHDSMRSKTAMSISTSDSASTIKAARSQYSAAPSAADMTAEEHLTLGIECHENGSLNESTYHLRHAAKLHHPTGMLLYALACRHGWGMRPNQKEGVEWLRKAADYASLEIADDEDQIKEGKPVNFLERKTRKAQFALSVYELGVSHMNGWGTDQDRALALRCFEIAGSMLPLSFPRARDMLT